MTMEGANTGPDDPQSGCDFTKELKDKGYIMAMDGIASHNSDGVLKKPIYYMSLDPDPVIPQSVRQKAGANAEIIKLQVDPEKIGSGGFGTCFRCFKKQERGSSHSATEKAICLKLGRYGKDENPHNLRELKNFGLLKSHDNIVRFLFVCTTENNRLCLGLEYFRGKDLSKTIKDYRQLGKPFPADHINIILKGVVSAVIHLQKFDMIHCDIKPHNVLFSSYSLKVKLIDLGCAFVTTENETDFGGTSQYMAPEMLGKNQKPHLDSTDIYSVGAMGYTLVTFRQPWKDDEDVAAAMRQESVHQVRLAIEKAMNDTTDTEMPDGTVQKLTRLQVSLRDFRTDHKKNYPAQCDLLCDMLSRDPAMRPSCGKIVSEISEKCSNLAQRAENRWFAKIAAEFMMNYPQSSETSGTPVPALPELDQSHSSTTPRPTEVPPPIYSKNRMLYSIHGDNTPATSEASHHASLGSRIYSVEAGQVERQGLNPELPLPNQRNLSQPIDGSKPNSQDIACYEFVPSTDDDLPLHKGLQYIKFNSSHMPEPRQVACP